MTKQTTGIRKKCVNLAKQIVRKKNNYTCQYCGRKEPVIKTHGSHIYSEGQYRSMSADLDNILCLCFTHHLGTWNKSEPSWHNNPIEMIEWFNKKFPKLAKKLKERKQKIVTCDYQFWENKLEELKKEYERTNNAKNTREENIKNDLPF